MFDPNPIRMQARKHCIQKTIPIVSDQTRKSIGHHFVKMQLLPDE